MLQLLSAPFLMIEDIRRSSWAVFIWGGFLNIPQLIGGLVFVNTAEGQWVLFALIAGLIVAGQIHRRSPFSRLVGLCHLPWLALLPWLIYRLGRIEEHGALSIWIGYVAVVMAISIALDIFDLYRHCAGRQSFSWARKDRHPGLTPPQASG